MIQVVNVRNCSPDAVYIGRAMPRQGRKASPLGNPFKPDDPNNEDDRQICLLKYKDWLWLQMRSETPALAELRRLAEMVKSVEVELACWCKPKSCHGDAVKAAVEWLTALGISPPAAAPAPAPPEAPRRE